MVDGWGWLDGRVKRGEAMVHFVCSMNDHLSGVLGKYRVEMAGLPEYFALSHAWISMQ